MGNKDELGKLIRFYRMSRNMTQAQLAEALGRSASTIAMYEIGQREPDMDTLEALADIFNISKRELVPDDEPKPLLSNTLNSHRVPLVGSAAAGEPIFDEEIDVYVNAPLKADCAIRVSGDSMEPTYLNGDILYIRSQPDVNYEGQIAVVICGDEACVKHVHKTPDGLSLASDNQKYAPMFKRFSDYDGNIRILGIIIGYTRMYEDC